MELTYAFCSVDICKPFNIDRYILLFVLSNSKLILICFYQIVSCVDGFQYLPSFWKGSFWVCWFGCFNDHSAVRLEEVFWFLLVFFLCSSYSYCFWIVLSALRVWINSYVFLLVFYVYVADVSICKFQLASLAHLQVQCSVFGFLLQFCWFMNKTVTNGS